MKTCTKCSAVKPIIEFITCTRNKDGHGAVCFACHRSQNRQLARAYYGNNSNRLRAVAAQRRAEKPDAVREWRKTEKGRTSSKRYYDANREKCATAAAKWREEHRLNFRQICARYYVENKPHFQELGKNYRAANPEANREKSRRRRAVKRNADIGESARIIAWEKQWREQSQVQCLWCLNVFRPSDCHADHVVPLSRGGLHSLDNLCVSCARCNLRKSDKPLDQWLGEIKRGRIAA